MFLSWFLRWFLRWFLLQRKGFKVAGGTVGWDLGVGGVMQDLDDLLANVLCHAATLILRIKNNVD